jgi:hypothetical protein
MQMEAIGLRELPLPQAALCVCLTVKILMTKLCNDRYRKNRLGSYDNLDAVLGRSAVGLQYTVHLKRFGSAIVTSYACAC